MGAINDRVAFLIKNQGLTQAKFADSLHLTQSHVSGLCSGAKNLSDRTISDICRVFSVSEAWLRDGVGEMYVRRSANEELAILVNDLMSDADESFRKRFVTALLELPPEFWPDFEVFLKKLQKESTGD